MKTKIKTCFKLLFVITFIFINTSYSQMFWNQAASISDTNISYVSYSNSSSLNITGSFTLEAWIKPSNISSNILGIVNKSKTLFSYSLTMDNKGNTLTVDN